jgi:acetyl esterase
MMVEKGNNMTEAAPFVRDDVRTFLAMLAELNRPELNEMPLEMARASYLAMRDFADLPACELAVIRDLACPGPAGDIALRLYDPRPTREPGPLMLFFHGGGFTIGDLESHHNICTQIAATMDLPLVAVHYRLAPERPFPAAPEDCEAAARWLAESPADLGRAVTGLIPIGDSAGGNLAIVTTQSLQLAPAAAPVILQVPIYPVCDDRRKHPSAELFKEGYLLTSAAMKFFDDCYGGDPADRRLFPMLGPLAGMPPTVLATASLDPLRDSGRAFAAELVLAGCDVTYLERAGTIHGFVQLRKAVPSAQHDLLAILAAAKSALERLA